MGGRGQSSGRASSGGKLEPIDVNPNWAYQPDEQTDLKDMVKNPIPFVGVGKDMELGIKFEEDTIQSKYQSSVDIEISKLQRLQPFVFKSGITNYQRFDYTDKPSVIEYKNKFYLLDGNHRVAKAKLDGKKTITVDISTRKDR